MKKSCIILTILLVVLLFGCAQQKTQVQSCKDGYFLFEDKCCRDQNSNEICDDKEDVLFQPAYSVTQDGPDDITETRVTDLSVDSQEEDYQEIVYEPVKPEIIDIEVPKQIFKSSYVQPDVELRGWEVENEFVRFEVKKLVFEVKKIKPIHRLSSDEETILKEIHFDITNLHYDYMNFELLFMLRDESDPQRIKELVDCSADDDFKLQGCHQGIREGDVLNIVMTVNEKMYHSELMKDFIFSLRNIRDDYHPERAIELSKTVNVTNILGAEYIRVG